MINSKFILNTTPCQYSKSKTFNAIQYIQQTFLSSCRINENNGTHHITIIYTNKSLAETIQWKYRLSKELKDLNVRVLSSRKDSVYNNFDQVLSSMLKIRKPDDLYDVLVMCSHKKRILNGIELVDMLKLKLLNLNHIGIQKITCSVFFDEADKAENTKYIKEFLSNKDFFKAETDEDLAIKDVHFITATPFPKFWKTLDKAGVTKLENINNYLKDMDCISSFEETYDNYRKLKEHNIIQVDDDDNNVNSYITKVLNMIDFSKPRVIYAPAKIYVSSHNEVVGILQQYGCDVLIINGKEKKIIFNNPNIEDIGITEFNEKYGVKGELRDTLMMYRKLYPNNHLGITGSICIERGITFCTNGFNFTDSIISNYHAKNKASLIQFLGRSNGHKDFVDIHNVYIPKHVYEEADNYINILIDVQRTEPEIFTEERFKDKKQIKQDRLKEQINEATSVPVLINLTDEEYDQIMNTKIGKRYNENVVLSFLKRDNISVDGLGRYQITCPKINTLSYKYYVENIRRFINEDRSSKGFSIPKKFIHSNIYMVIIDQINKDLLVIRHYGERINQ